MMDECDEELPSGGNPFDELATVPAALPVPAESEALKDASDVDTLDMSARAVEMSSSWSTSVVAAVKNPVAVVGGSKGTNPFDAVVGSKGTNPFGTVATDSSDPGCALQVHTLEAVRIYNRDWDEEWDHVASCVKRSVVSVSVVSPEVVSSLMAKHVVYTVKSEPSKYIVRRRYNDFAWLRETLAATYEGLFIPSIPATTAFGNNSVGGGSKTDVNGDFVKNRMQQLHLFMQQLCKIPFLRTDPSLHHFLSMQSEKEFKQVTEAPVSVTNGGGAENWTNVGLSMWLKLVDSTTMDPIAAERVVTDFKRQLDLLAHRLKLVDNECRSAGKKAVVCAAAMGTLSDLVTAWSTAEADLADPRKNEYVDPYGKVRKAQMEGLAAGHLHWSQSVGLVPKILARLLISHVQFQQVQVARFREHLVARDLLFKELEKAEKEKLKALEDKQAAASPSNVGKRQSRSIMFAKGPEELEEVAQRKTEHVAMLQARADRITRALTFCEIHRFSKDRLQALSSLVGALSAAQLQMAQASVTKWTDIAAQIGLDVAQYTENAKSLLASSASLDEDLLGFDVSDHA